MSPGLVPPTPTDMTILVLLLVLAMTLYVAVGRRTAKERDALGLQHGSIVAADDARIGSPTLRSKRLRLVGRPDHVLRSGGVFIPIEQNLTQPDCSCLMRFRLPLSAQVTLGSSVTAIDSKRPC